MGMRCCVGWVCLLFGLLLWLVGCVGGAGKAGGMVGEPVLVLGDTVLDFGRLRDVETVERSVRVSNGGGGELRVVVDPPSCGCLSVRPMERVLRAGEEYRLRVALSGRGLSGHELKWIRLRSNGSPSEAMLYVLAVVDGGLQFELVND